MNRIELIKTLETVSRGLSNNNIAPAFSFFCFTGETVFSWNDSIGIVGPCKVKEPFGCHGATLLGLLKNCKTPGVEFEVQKDYLLIIAGNSEFKLPYITQDEFLWKEPDHENWESLQFPKPSVETCLSTCSNDIALGVFNQVCLHGKYVYSCDGDAITKCTTIIGDDDCHPSLCLSQNFASNVVKICNELDWLEPDFVFNNEWVGILDEYRIYGRNLGQPQLDYEAEIRKSVGVNNFKFVPIPPELNDALSRARVVADAETKPTLLEIGGDHISLGTDTPMGYVSDVVKTDHSNITVNISAAMLQKSLEGCTEFCVTTNCILLKGERILRLIANMSDEV